MGQSSMFLTFALVHDLKFNGGELQFGSGNLGGGDSFVGNIPNPSPSLHEACLKIISGS